MLAESNAKSRAICGLFELYEASQEASKNISSPKKHPCNKVENWTLVHLEDLKSFEIIEPTLENTLG
jgi:hypothetical protein